MEIRMTGDGSQTIFLPSLGESYHSHFGAVSESMHVFINAGFYHLANNLEKINILEIGLGTGLNILLTFIEARKLGLDVEYHAIEPFPPDRLVTASLNYPEILKTSEVEKVFHYIHSSEWNQKISLFPNFMIKKLKTTLQDFSLEAPMFHLVYYDAFSPAVQPELWTPEMLEKIGRITLPGGVLVTYSAKGQVRRNLQRAGFVVERLPGPAGKREMLRGVKHSSHRRDLDINAIFLSQKILASYNPGSNKDKI